MAWPVALLAVDDGSAMARHGHRAHPYVQTVLQQTTIIGAADACRMA
ncbi:MAG: hypothetical protein FWF71_00950 [Actinomycetia bacterium]|nr:hypothetical protein [Actinomycetes bacterium]